MMCWEAEGAKFSSNGLMEGRRPFVINIVNKYISTKQLVQIKK
jgi:hypothetical protein